MTHVQIPALREQHDPLTGTSYTTKRPEYVRWVWGFLHNIIYISFLTLFELQLLNQAFCMKEETQRTKQKPKKKTWWAVQKNREDLVRKMSQIRNYQTCKVFQPPEHIPDSTAELPKDQRRTDDLQEYHQQHMKIAMRKAGQMLHEYQRWMCQDSQELVGKV